MNEIKIKCPTCGKILRLADAPNINQSTFTCPVCQDKHVVGKCQQYVAPSSAEETQYGGSANRTLHGGDETQITNGNTKGGDETQIAGGRTSGGEKTRIYSAPQKPAIGSLVDANGRTYCLRQGANTIGRKAQTSQATVQIITDDRYMSRNHAIIVVQQAGNRFVHILKNGENKNPSYRNGVLIADGDQEILNNGDSMTFGKTQLTFRL